MFFLLFTLVGPVCLSGQSGGNEEHAAQLEQVNAELAGSMADTTRIRLLKKAIGLASKTDRSLMGPYLDQLLPLAKRTGDNVSLGFYHNQQANLDYFGGQMEMAIGKYQTAGNFFEKGEDESMAIQMRTRAGLMACLQGRYAEAEGVYRQQMLLAEKGGYDDALAFIFNQMGTLYHYQNGVDSANYYYEKAENSYAEIKDTLGMLRPMYNHAILEFSSGNTQQAIELYLFMATIQEAKGATNDLLYTYGSLAGGYERMGQYYEAMDYAQKSILLTEKLGDVVGRVDAIHTLARINTYLKDYDKAFGLLENALSLAEDAQLIDAIIFTEIQISLAKMRINASQEAVTVLEKTLSRMDTMSDSRFRPMVLGQLGQGYLHLKEYEKSQQLLEEAMELYKIAGDEGAFLQFQYVLGDLYLKKGMPQKAVELGEKSYEWARQTQAEREMRDNAELLAMAHKQLGNYKEALNYFETFKTLSDSLINIENVRVLTVKEKDFDFQQEKNEMAIQQTQREALLKAETKQTRTAAAGIAGIALLGFGFFWNARRKNKTITEQNQQLNLLNTTKDRIFSIIGHDLRKPAISFRDLSETIRYLVQKKDYNRLEKLATEVEKDTYSLYKLTDNLLSWALMQRNVMPYNPMAIAPAEVAEETVELFSHIARNKQIELTSEVPNGLEVYADPNALSTILRNLVDNALKYTDKGGKVTITALSTENGVKMQIADNGHGIPADQLDNIFLLRKDKSAKGTDGEKGTGLGLHLIHELVKLNRGVIKVASQVGEGTKFEVVMPAVG